MSTRIALEPYDEHNRRLESNVHPPDWTNPKPSGRYNLVVVGAGTAGLVAAAGAAGLGAKVALVERQLMGGDCLNVGCVPSKGLLSAARAMRQVRNAYKLGIQMPGEVSADFPSVMERMRRLRAEISPADSADRFRGLGVDVFLGQGTFTSSNTVQVGDQTLRFKKAVIATGTRAKAPPIAGLDTVEYLTNESIFSLTELPKRLGVVGAGPVGCELAQAFALFGSEVFLVEAEHGILPREDREAAKVVEASLTRDGVQLLCCGRELCVESESTGGVRMKLQSHDNTYDQSVDKLLVAAGRAPNVEDLGLKTAGVAFDQQGVKVDDRLKTTNPNIYAAGDVCSTYKFTHAADFMARTVIQNALFFGRAKKSSLVIPWATYTSPELAHVGLTPSKAKEQNVEIQTFTQKFDDVDRALLDGQTEGFVKVHVRKGSDEIVGATIVAPEAGDMISELSLAMTHGIGLKKIAKTIHPYPTHAEAIRKLADQFNRTRLTPRVKSLMQIWLRWTR